jgi:hypothetical protein
MSVYRSEMKKQLLLQVLQNSFVVLTCSICIEAVHVIYICILFIIVLFFSILVQKKKIDKNGISFLSPLHSSGDIKG